MVAALSTKIGLGLLRVGRRLSISNSRSWSRSKQYPRKVVPARAGIQIGILFKDCRGIASTGQSVTRLGMLIALLLASLYASTTSAQELEPRALTNVPIGLNFAGVGYAYTVGNMLLDPAVPVEDLNAKLHILAGVYVRAIDFFGMSGKIDAIVPFANGDWTGILAGRDTMRTASGMGDPRFRLSVNLIGAPALRLSEFRTYKQRVIVGTSLQVIVPVGQYDATKLLNLGSNRWTFRWQFGAGFAAGKWTIETMGGLWVFLKNTDFWGGRELEQRPLATAKVHLIRSFRRGFWLAANLGYGYGGRGIVNGVESDARISTFRLGLTLAVPISNAHTIRLVATSGARIEEGPDFDAIALFYMYRWGGG